MKKIIIIGGGGHGRTLKAVLDIGKKFEILGFTDLESKEIKGFKYLGNDSVLNNYSPKEVFLVNGIGSVKQPSIRCQIYKKFKDKGYKFCSVIHPKAIILPDVKLSEGVQIMAGAIINIGVILGENIIVNTAAVIDHDCKIGAHTHIAPSVTLSGGVCIGQCSHVGAGATIIQGITIGDETLIGAGAVVVDELPSRVKAVGVPAKIYK